MVFEEFFKKKRIDLIALQQSEPALFSEFKAHYEQMGEKSFDHTKKYWFNKIRRSFPLAVEVKTEKPKIENQLAEQTITEALIDEGATPAPKLGFVPKFRAGSVAKPTAEEKPVPIAPPAIDEQTTQPTAKLGFVPKFKAAGMPKPVTEDQQEPGEPSVSTEPAAPAPKPGFKPKFKAANPVKQVEDQPEVIEPVQTGDPGTPVPKLGFKPKFKAGVTKPIGASEAQAGPGNIAPSAEKESAAVAESTTPVEAIAPAPKLGFKPKFKAANPPKPSEE